MRKRVIRNLRSMAAMAVLAVSASLIASAPTAAQPGGHDDVPEDAYYSVPIVSLSEQGVFAGTLCADGFCPGGVIDRKTMAVWTIRVVTGREPPAVSETRFDDVDADSFYAPFIERMAQLGITRGCGDGSGFCPDRTVTRAQMAVFLSRAYRLPDARDPGFSDVAEDAWYAADVATLASSGITRGCGDGSGFCPGRATTRAQMATFLFRAQVAGFPGADTIIMARADWSSGYFQAQVLKQLLEELGYQVTEPSAREMPLSQAYIAIAEGDVDLWANSWYPSHFRRWEAELPDGSKVGDHLEVPGALMSSGALQGYVVTKSVADEHGITHLDQINDDPELTALFDIDRDGKAEIYGCQESWTCDDIINSQIAFSRWKYIEQVVGGYGAMAAQAEAKVTAGEPVVLYIWAPSAYLVRFRPGDNVVWLAVEEVLDDSNPLRVEGGAFFDQRPGRAHLPPEQCPAAAEADACQVGWVANDIVVTANKDFLRTKPAAYALLEEVKISVIDVSLANARALDEEVSVAKLAAEWIAANRPAVNQWLAAARAASLSQS